MKTTLDYALEAAEIQNAAILAAGQALREKIAAWRALVRSVGRLDADWILREDIRRVLSYRRNAIRSRDTLLTIARMHQPPVARP